MSGKKKCDGGTIFRNIKELVEWEGILLKKLEEWKEAKEVKRTIAHIQRQFVKLIELELEHYHPTPRCKQCPICQKVEQIKKIIKEGMFLKRLVHRSLMDQSEIIKEIYQEVKKVISA